jgi:hypothetical protein
MYTSLTTFVHIEGNGGEKEGLGGDEMQLLSVFNSGIS